MNTKTSKQFALLSVAFIIVLLTSCTKEKEQSIATPYAIRGKVQKGPYINGTKVMLYELSSSLAPTGKVFSTLITNDRGSFSFDKLNLISPYVLLDCDGYYFNEVSGKLSTSRLNLFALADLSSDSVVNVNLMTSVEKARIEQLVQSGKSFLEAKKQAQNELLSIFSLGSQSIPRSELLDIMGSSAGDDVLLAVSAVLQGTHTEAELTELLTHISNDIKDDGTLDSPLLQSALINEARILNTDSVRTNLGNRYKQLGITSLVPAFETPLNKFITQSPYAFTKLISYPENGNYGYNILSTKRDSFPAYTTTKEVTVSMAAEIPEGTKLRVRFLPGKIVTPVTLTDTTTVNTGTEYISDWAISVPPGIQCDWNYSEYNTLDHSRIFNNFKTGPIDLKVYLFRTPGNATIEIYENNSVIPTRIKKIKW